MHPIEAESFRRLRRLVDTSHLPPRSRAVAERVIHASADTSYLDDLVLDEAALDRGADALRAGAPVITDVTMIAAGISGHPTTCLLNDARVHPLAQRDGSTRAAAALRLAASEAGPGAIYVVGCAPTALFALCDLPAAEPSLVIGLPVGFVDAVESKQALRDTGLPAVSNRGPKGGSAVAVAAFNALRRSNSRASVLRCVVGRPVPR
jgi:precorrin-8X/cobalt-precorrin-8 methylmutase